MQITAKEIATIINGKVEGNPDIVVSTPSKIEDGKEGTITFLANSKYEHYLYTTKASVIIVSDTFKLKEPIDQTLIWVPDAYHSLSVLLSMFEMYKDEKVEYTISPRSEISPDTNIDEKVYVGHFTVIEAGVEVGAGTIIRDQVFIGKGVKIGKNCLFHSGVKIYRDCEIGDNCVLHSNTVIGSDGFGFAPTNGSYNKIAQIGNVVIEDDVEIGAGTTIDRATMGTTLIKKGAKLDNLIQIGHNVVIGEYTVIAALTGVAGSTTIGKHCRIGGQVGIIGHIDIADHTMIQAQSGVGKSIKKPGEALYGSPAISYNNYLRSYAGFKTLPNLMKKISTLENKIKKLLKEE